MRFSKLLNKRDKAPQPLEQLEAELLTNDTPTTEHHHHQDAAAFMEEPYSSSMDEGHYTKKGVLAAGKKVTVNRHSTTMTNAAYSRKK